ncbi:MAG TPA: PaaI family thioesterase [Bryobacteraceae bacterium]|nr:PaaI family thioesterase [Bryobacteraceae bacterium]
MPKNLVEDFLNRGAGFLPGLIGIEFLTIEPGRTEARLPIRRELLAPNGYLHAASVVALADTACGFGTIATLPEGAANFTTIELKSNFVGTVTDGAIRCDATCLHRGKKTQVWDAVVKDEASGRVLALFRCTQMLITA